MRDDEAMHDAAIAAMRKWNLNHGGDMHILTYTAFLKYGIFGHFQFAGDQVPFCDTLSHAYQKQGIWLPIVMPGVYTCQRGKHRLHGMTEDFETFEITGVPDHSGLLFHWLNYNAQSEGCTGLGASRIRYDSNKDGKIDVLDDEMITASKFTFAAWMKRLEGVDSFVLSVQ